MPKFRPEVLFEDNHLLVVNKPAGWLTQGDRSGDQPLREALMSWIKVRDAKPGRVFLHPVHRLDRPVSGCLIFSKTSKSLSRMTQLFKRKAVDKHYSAICTLTSGSRKVGTHYVIDGYIKKHSRRNIVEHRKKPFEGAKHAQTEVELVRTLDGYYLFACKPLTGRSHQIRVQLSSIGYPIVGDLKYGGIKHDPGSILLHSTSCRFIHPVRKTELHVEAPFPNDPLWSKMQR
ncbi:MAG: RluA family pseudouridine synthase [Saprospiraceae bacterium]|nr:RluA family pseudouridine synthase [Saprospiraceae bacterium]